LYCFFFSSSRVPCATNKPITLKNHRHSIRAQARERDAGRPCDSKKVFCIGTRPKREKNNNTTMAKDSLNHNDALLNILAQAREGR
jgi:hypothetical protein